jgi:Holliday junction DNA helicase RuvA
MIRHLTGHITQKMSNSIVLDVSGVGYQVFVSPPTSQLLAGDTASLWIHMAVRETSMELFGFIENEELELFEMLLDVSGVGPRSALAITAVASIDTLKRAIGQGDISHLTSVSGIGKRTAEKIVVELKDKLAALGWDDEHGGLQQDLDVVEALAALGYGKPEIRVALKNIPESMTGTNERIREALKHL